VILDYRRGDVLLISVHPDEHECWLSVVLTRRVGPNSHAAGLRKKPLDSGSPEEPGSMVIRSSAPTIVAYEPLRILERDIVPFVSGKGHENTLARAVREASCATTGPRRAHQ